MKAKEGKGRPTRRWTEDIKEWLQMSPTEAGREAQKMEVSRRMVLIFLFIFYLFFIYTLLIPFGKFVFVTLRNCVATEQRH